jgi:protein-S-isoprenylcysteine O-methyltransferase Ste14
MRRSVFFVYGVACHVLFLVVYAWMFAFVGNLSLGLIRTIDGPATGSLAGALAIDALLIAAFAVPHSVMARPAFKRWWTRFVPQPIERSTYVLVSCLLMGLLLWQWRPIGGVVWDVTHPAGRWPLYALFAAGWLMVPAVSLLINHFDLFGSRQVWLHLRGRAYSHLPFRTPGAYRFVRHPLYVGWMLAFWAAPTMTAAHLLFAALMTAYMLIAIPFEERDLIAHFGDQYLEYRRRVGALIPRLWGREGGPDVAGGPSTKPYHREQPVSAVSE